MPIAIRRAVIGASIVAALSMTRGSAADAQDTASTARLPTVQVTVTRETARSPLELPYAISTIRPDSLRPGARQLSLDETLMLIPGIAVSNRNNPTQDPRVSIRGFGARSAFGVRGVRVLRDGIPLTLPDGQTPVDYIDLESVETIQVIRGTASALYGNAAGGVIDLQSEALPSAALGGQLRASGGSHGLQRWHGTVGGTSAPFGYQASVTRTDMDGFRDHARQRTTHALARAELRTGAATWALQGIGFDMPIADNPGALTAAEFEANPQAADPTMVTKRARKDVRQGQLSLTGAGRWGRADLSASLYGGARDLYNPLAFAIVAVDRVSYGATVRATLPASFFGAMHRFSAGFDVQRQEDDRTEVANCNGSPPTAPGCSAPVGERGALRRSQRELVTGIGPYLRDEIEINDWLTVSAGVRADRVRFEVKDRFVTPTNGDDSGERTLPAVSPMVGMVARISPLASLYASVSSSFETPTATELANKPDGSTGINEELEPQKAVTYEIGAKGFIAPIFAYDVAVFVADVRDELIPYEILSGGTRRYFRNAGRTERRGLEVGLRADGSMLRAGLSYSFADYEFKDYDVPTLVGGDAISTTEYDGKRIPGIPEHQAQASVTLIARGIHSTLEGIAAGRTLVNDDNSVSAPGYGVVNIRIGGTLSFGNGASISPTVGVQNLLDRKYVGAVSINADGGRYFEPAPGRTLFAGLTIAR
jgi:iron complex outermembrane receptor protein